MNRGNCNAIWALLGSSPTVTLQEIELLGEVDPLHALAYLSELMRSGYADFAGCKRQESGSYEVSWRQTRRTGDFAPYIDESGQFVDPNLENPPISPFRKGGGREPQPGFRATGLPSLSARVRIAAEKFPEAVTKNRLREAMNILPAEMLRFNETWYNMKRRAVFCAILGSKEYRYRSNPDIEAVRDHLRRTLALKNAAGWGSELEITGIQISKDLQKDVIPGSVIRSALDVLAAEGYQVSVRGTGRNGGGYQERAVYRIGRKTEGEKGNPGEPASCKKPDSPAPLPARTPNSGSCRRTCRSRGEDDGRANSTE